MWKYIVTWCIVTTASDLAYRTDQFGRRSHELYSYKQFECSHSREFYNRKEAFDFFWEAKAECPDTGNDGRIYYAERQSQPLHNVRIDSVWNKYINRCSDTLTLWVTPIMLDSIIKDTIVLQKYLAVPQTK